MQRFFAVDGQLVLPGLVDMHQHLDKSRTRALLDNPSGTLIGASAAYRALAPSITKEQMIARARRTVEACSASWHRRHPQPYQYRSANRRARRRGHGRVAGAVRSFHAHPDRGPCHLGRHLDAAGERRLVTGGDRSWNRCHWRRAGIFLRACRVAEAAVRQRRAQRLAARHAHRRTSRRRQSDVQRNRQDDAGLWHGRPRGRGPLFGPERHGAGRGAAHDRGVARGRRRHRHAAGCEFCFCRDAMPIACRRAD